MATTTMMSVPEQRMASLHHANEVRIVRARVKEQIRAGELSVVDVLDDPPEDLLSLRVWELLINQPRWGLVRVRRFLGAQGLSELKMLGSLTDRQREAVAVELTRIAAHS